MMGDSRHRTILTQQPARHWPMRNWESMSRATLDDVDDWEGRRPYRRPLHRRLLRVLLAAALAVLVLLLPEVLRVALGPNFHTVIERRVYRAAQPSAATIERYVHQYGIHSIINLRGVNTDEQWFQDEEKVAWREGVDLFHVNLCASEKPLADDVRALIDALEEAVPPLLIHCNSGADRTGFASACYLLLKTDATLSEARAQLSLRYGHFSWGRARCQGQMLDSYRVWLSARGAEHSRDLFRHWARDVYEKDDWPR